MATRRDVKFFEAVGSINSLTTPSVVSGIDCQPGDLVVASAFFAQALGTNNTMTDPAGTAKATSDGTSANRLGGIFWAISDTVGEFASMSFQCNATSTRVCIVVEVWTPTAGFEWDPASVVAAGPEWNGSASTSDSFPALASRSLMLGVLMTNKGASTTESTHAAAGGGTDTQQANSPSVAYPSSASDSVVSMTVGGTGVTFNVSQANALAYSFGIDELEDVPVLPDVTGHGFSTVSQMMQTPGSTSAHRNLGGTYPEMTEYGVRMAANLGHGMIEISCQRSSDGVWFGSHDETPDRVANETTYDGSNFSTLTWAQISTLTAGVGASGAPRPFATLTQLVQTLPSDFIFMVDPKQSGASATPFAEFLDLVDSLLGPARAIIKLDVYQAVARFQEAQARGYKTAAYLYGPPSTESDAGVVAARMPYTDFPGLNYNATNWATLQALYPGKLWWGHVAASQANYDQAITNGAHFVQSTSSSITPVGIESWVPPTMEGLTLMDLEVAWLRQESGISGPASLADLRRAVYGVDQPWVETLRNRALVPQAVIGTGGAAWTMDWGTAGAGSNALENGLFKSTWSAAPSGGNVRIALARAAAHRIPVTPGETLTVSFDAASDISAGAAVVLDYRDAAGTYVSQAGGSAVVLPADTAAPVRLSRTVTIPIGTGIAYMDVLLSVSSAAATVGKWLAAGELQVESGFNTSRYIDGDLPDSELMRAQWLGAANGSQSTLEQRAPASPFSYFAALSGLTPAERYSLSDHKLAYYRLVTGSGGTLSDAARAFFEMELA